MTVSAVSVIGEGPKSNPLQIWAVNTPSAPLLSLSDTARSSCSVYWSAVSPPSNSLITGYRLYIDDGLDGDYQIAYDGTDKPSVLSRTVEGLEPRLTYRLKVSAINKAGEGAQSNVITCFTVTIPGQPGTPVLVSSTSTSIRVKWSPAFDDGGSPIQQYVLEMDEVEGIGYANVENWQIVFAGDALEYEVSSGLTATLVYRFRVRAVSEYAKLSLYSEISEFYAAPLPDMITFPASPFTELGASFLKFTWHQPSINLALKLPILSYKVYYDASYLLSGQFTLLDTVTSYDQFFYRTADILVPGKRYRFQVSAVNAIGEGPLSTEIASFAFSLPGIPKKPFRITSEKSGANKASITIGWEPLTETGSVPLTGYKLYMTSDADGRELAYDGTDNVAQLQVKLNNLKKDTDYEFELTGLNPLEGSPSESVTYRVAGFPDAPGEITEVPDSLTGESIGLTWQAPLEDGGSAIVAYTLVQVV